MILGDKLYRLRKSKKLSQEQLALELQVSKTAIIKWEQNKAKPSVENILKIELNQFSVKLALNMRAFFLCI